MTHITYSTTLLDLIDTDDFLSNWQGLELFILDIEPSKLERLDGKSYPIKTIQDIISLPKDSIHACLNELKPMLSMLNTTIVSMRDVLGTSIKVNDVIKDNNFLWIDDFENISDLHVQIV